MRFTSVNPNETLVEQRENQLDDLERLFDQGYSLEEILERTKVDIDTVINHYHDLMVINMDIFA